MAGLHISKSLGWLVFFGYSTRTNALPSPIGLELATQGWIERYTVPNTNHIAWRLTPAGREQITEHAKTWGLDPKKAINE